MFADEIAFKFGQKGELCDTGTVMVTINAVNDASVVSVNPAVQEVQYSDNIKPVTIWVQIMDKADVVIPAMSMAEPATENAVDVSGEGIFVPH